MIYGGPMREADGELPPWPSTELSRLDVIAERLAHLRIRIGKMAVAENNPLDEQALFDALKREVEEQERQRKAAEEAAKKDG
jgi:hypothetical protein